MTVVSALDNPLAILLADNLADVVAPDHDRTDRRTAGVGAIMRPGTREVVLRPWVGQDLMAHVTSTPGPRPASQTRMPIARVRVTRALVTVARALVGGVLEARGFESRTKAHISITVSLSELPIAGMSIVHEMMVGVMPRMTVGIMPIMVMRGSRFSARCECK